MKLIVGLGNPGKKYEHTRHNAGYLVVDALIAHAGDKLIEGKGPFQISQKPFLNDALIAKPAVFMNESGRAVKALLDHLQITAQECLIVVDEVNLPLGTNRFRVRGSAGGHHGLESINQVLGTEDFPRLRIGVGRGNEAGQDLTPIVLGEFTKDEWELLSPQILKARDVCLEWIKSGSVAAPGF